MKALILSLGLTAMLTWQSASAQTIVINEIMASNVDAVLDPSTNYGSWIELYNPTDTDFDLSGLYVSDDPANLRKFRLNETNPTVYADWFKVIYFDHHSIYSPNQVDFKLNYAGGTIMLTDGENILASETYPQAVGRTSYARQTDGGDSWGVTYTPTPAASNAGSLFGTRQLPAPVFDLQTPFAKNGQTVSLAVGDNADVTIRYTLNGSTPTLENGNDYTAPIKLTKNTIIRARAFRTGYLPSEVATRTYITDGTSYPFPIVSVVTDEDNLYDSERGIFVRGWNGRAGNGQSWPCNWNMDWDRPVNFEYITTDGEYAVNQEVDMAMCGGWSRAWTPHSFKLKAAKYYMGRNSFDYDFFPTSKPALKHRVLQIRNGGNDTSNRIKDAALQEVVRRSGLYLDCQAWQPVHVFLNGQYYTVLNMREPNNKRFAQSNYNIDPDEMDQFEINPDSGYVQMVGTYDKFQELYDLSAQAADPEAYDQICQMLDIDEYINYMAVQLYLCNSDWPQNNVKGFRDCGDGKFHCVLFDLDFAFGSDNTPSDVNPFATFAAKKVYTFNHLYGYYSYYYDFETDDWYYTCLTPWQDGDHVKEEIQFVTIFLQLLQNEQFRRQFIDTYCIVGGSVFEPTRVKEIVTEVRDSLNLGMSLTGESSSNTAGKIISALTSTRQNNMITYLKNYDPMELKSTKTSTLNLSCFVRNEEGKQVAFDAARIFINGLAVPTGKIKGKMFHPLTVEAVAPAGYKFEGWTDVTGRTIKQTDAKFTVAESLSSLSYRATWVKMTPEELAAAGRCDAPVVINEVSAANDIYINDYQKREDWIELYNPTDSAIDLSGLYLTDNPDLPQKYQIPSDPTLNTILPAYGYQIIWCDKQPSIGPAIHANFKLAKEGGTVMLSRYADDGTLAYMDSLHYVKHTGLQSFGRYPDGATQAYTMQRPSLLLANVHTPLSIPLRSSLKGDIDQDGRITVSDITLLIAAYLDSTAGVDEAAPADMSDLYDIDGDTHVTVSDITLLISLYLEGQ